MSAHLPVREYVPFSVGSPAILGLIDRLFYFILSIWTAGDSVTVEMHQQVRDYFFGYNLTVSFTLAAW